MGQYSNSVNMFVKVSHGGTFGGTELPLSDKLKSLVPLDAV